MNNPCYKCKNRKRLCHASCEGYLEWKEQDRKIKEIARETKTLEFLLFHRTLTAKSSYM